MNELETNIAGRSARAASMLDVPGPGAGPAGLVLAHARSDHDDGSTEPFETVGHR